MDMWTTIGIVLVVLSPVLWFLGGFLMKLFWGMWPLFLCLVTGGYILWSRGMDAFVAVPLGIIGGIVITWLWQRSTMFLRVDDKLGRITLID